MKANIRELLDIQREVNSKIKEKLKEEITTGHYILAFNVELFEYFNAIGVWKWWKHSHKIKKDRILDELADCFAFYLSLVDLQNKILLLTGETEDIIQTIENEINYIINHFEMERNEEEPKIETVKDLIMYVSTDNEVGSATSTTQRFAIAIYIAMLLFENITWDEITKAYKKKSNINIQRQVENY